MATDIKLKTTEPDRHSLDGETAALTEANSTFNLKDACRLLSIIFKTATPDYTNPIKVFRKVTSHSGAVTTEQIALSNTTHDLTFSFGSGKPCDRGDSIYFECASTASKTVIVEVVKWSL